MAINLMWIALGGAFGALLRFGVSISTIRVLGDHFPYGTLLVNVMGSLAIGFLWSINEKEPFTDNTGSFVFMGLLGAFTTFSTYSLDTMRMIQEGRMIAGAANVFANNIGALSAAVVGYMLGRWLKAGT